MNLPKFHDRKSLVIGMMAGIVLVIIGWAIGVDRLLPGRQWLVGLFIAMVGGALAIHCFDTLRYYRKHRIIKIEKTDTHRIVTKE